MWSSALCHARRRGRCGRMNCGPRCQMSEPFVKTIWPQSLLSFAPDSEPIQLTPLNVLIGPNGSGKSNLVEVFELLKALPTDVTDAIPCGGRDRGVDVET